nr:hypothetical protein [Tanacetum cinerariifolium]
MNQLCSTVRIDFEDSERAGPTGFKLSREYLQSRIEKQHLITNIENAVFDLVIMKLFSSFFVDERILTRRYGVQPIEVLYAVRNAYNASSSLSLHKARFSPTVLSRMRFNPRLVTSTCPLVYWWYAVDSRWVTLYFAMSLENLSLQK